MKKRWLFSIISLIMTMVIFLTGCTLNLGDVGDEVEKEDVSKVPEATQTSQGTLIEINQGLVSVKAPYEPRVFEAMVEPYKVESNFSNIENLEIFGEFSKEQLELLMKNNFVVNPTKEEQLFYIYEDNEYKDIPSFITTDSVLQVYHIFYDYTLRTLENEKLLGLVEEMTEKMLKNSIDLFNELENGEIKALQLNNIGFFAVAQLALEKELPGGIPEEAKKLALEEFEKIVEHSGFEESSLFPYELDYSQYTVRGHYTRSEDLGRYFRTMMWYGQAPFPLYFADGERNVEQTIQALLITASLYSDRESNENWENIYEPTNFFVGSSDDLSIYDYGKLLVDVYGNRPDLNKLNDKDKIEKLYKEAEKLPEPRIQAKFTTVTTPVGKQFRLMGQRYVMDADIMQDLVEPMIRPVSSGLDLMAVFGSERAKEIQVNQEINQYWEEYPSEIERLKNKFGKLPEEKWMENMYQGWLWTLLGYIEPFGKGYPSFMTNEAWLDKDLNTALGSWSELKHDTILYGKQVGAEMGGEDYGVVGGYVEPNIEVYEKLLWLTKFSRKNLSARNLAIEEIDNKMEEFEKILEFLINASIKQLRNEELTEDEYEYIQIFGGVLEGLTASFGGEGLRWFEITSETDKNMAVIADFQTIGPNQYSDEGYMEAGVGPAYEIYVVVPMGGKLYLTRGAVFSYHEFISNERLTDEAWQGMIKEDTQPPMPEWTNSFIRGGKGEIPYPDYNY